MKCRLLESFAYLAFPPLWPIVKSFALTAFPVPYIFNSTEKPTRCKAAFLDKGGDHGILPKWLRSNVQGFDRGSRQRFPSAQQCQNVNKLLKKIKKVSRTPSVAQQSLPCSYSTLIFVNGLSGSSGFQNNFSIVFISSIRLIRLLDLKM